MWQSHGASPFELDHALPPLESQADLLRRIAEALDRLAPPAPDKPDFDAAEAFIWRADTGALAPVAHVNRVDIALLRGIDRVRDLLVENTERFARALPANNALLWGARGMGKSSLVKAAHASINRKSEVAGRLKLVEIHREDIEGLPALMGLFARRALIGSSFSATTCRSTPATRPTSR